MQDITEIPGDLVRIRVRLVPRSSRAEIAGWLESGELKVRVTSAPVEEAANRELIRFLAKALGIKRADITITAGVHSRVKHLELPLLCKNRLLSFDNIC